MTVNLDKLTLFPSLPDVLRSPLFDCFNEILRNFREHRWEPSELNGGKLCEIVYTILRGHIDGSFPNAPAKPRNMIDACRAFEQSPPTFNRSVRIQIPRMLIALYEIRNNRGVGHAGGDVNPNHMDAVAVLCMAKWVMAELVRLFHGVDTESATAAVETLIERTIPFIWEIGGKHRVLRTELSMRQKTLVLLYQFQREVLEADLISWVEHSNPPVYRRDILGKLHRDRFIEYDETDRTVVISPKGIKHVEESIDLAL